MISHKHKSIFIHIPRCGGTSIESWLAGDDWWNIDAESKHLLASQAKVRYQNYWDEYFKFSIVRNPLSRVVSCLKYADHFHMKLESSGDIDFSEYHRVFGRDVILEIDHRFHARDSVENSKHKTGQIYMNILDEPMDRIFKFEDFDGIGRELQDILRIRDPLNRREERSTHQHVPTEGTIQYVRSIYREDIRIFSYSV